ncbi:hypothetical protein EAF00_010565 [Botryotinia globosa]|nr:hypothetical protein EAF00_010565 [Botryotinia globosa]
MPSSGSQTARGKIPKEKPTNAVQPRPPNSKTRERSSSQNSSSNDQVKKSGNNDKKKISYPFTFADSKDWTLEDLRNMTEKYNKETAAMLKPIDITKENKHARDIIPDFHKLRAGKFLKSLKSATQALRTKSAEISHEHNKDTIAQLDKDIAAHEVKLKNFKTYPMPRSRGL